MSLDYEKDLIIYTFAFDSSNATILKQKNDDGEEYLIMFKSLGSNGDELKYLTMDKKYFLVFKVVKHVWPFILKYHKKFIVPYPRVRNIFV